MEEFYHHGVRWTHWCNRFSKNADHAALTGRAAPHISSTETPLKKFNRNACLGAQTQGPWKIMLWRTAKSTCKEDRGDKKLNHSTKPRASGAHQIKFKASPVGCMGCTPGVIDAAISNISLPSCVNSVGKSKIAQPSLALPSSTRKCMPNLRPTL